jgi:DNA-binding XRE family transcriptional regulator
MSTAQLPAPRAAREKAGLRQVDVASKAGVSVQTVIRCENGNRYPRQEAARRAYLAALGLSA